MKNLIVLLLIFPSWAFAAFTEYYCQSGGSDLNSGSTTDNTAPYTTAAGNWTSATRVFTVTDGTNPSTHISVNDFCSVYVTSGATVATFIGRATTIQNATNGTVTFSSTFAGSNPSNGSGTMTLKRGGAWHGPNAASAFPFNLASLANLTNTNSDQVRINMKNDASYSSNAASLAFNTYTTCVIQGYSSSVGDGGKATLTNSSTAAGGSNQYTLSQTNGTWIDLIWDNTGASNAATLVGVSANLNLFIRNVFRNARNQGVSSSGNGNIFYECEWYNNNQSNTSNSGNMYANGIGTVVINGYSHDAANGSGYYNAVSSSLCLINSIADTNPGSGYETISSGGVVYQSDFYNNTGDAIKGTMVAVNAPFLIVNNNFIKNGGKGINNTKAGQTGIVYNNGYGSGTQANGSSDTLQSIIDTSTSITYASGVTPYVAPTTGNFSDNLPAAQRVGRGHFEENDGTNTGTVGFPDIGAAQAQLGVAFPTPTATPTATATNTPTPTPTSTVEISYGYSH